MAASEDLSSSISSLASASSYDFVSDSSHDRYSLSEESDDEVVYSISEASDAEVQSDDDFVVLRRAPERSQVAATPLGRPIEPQNVPLPLQEDESEDEDEDDNDDDEPPSLVNSESNSESPSGSRTPSTVDGLASDLEGLQVASEDNDAAPAQTPAPIAVPSPVVLAADSAPATVLRRSAGIAAAASGGQHLPSLPERSLLNQQLSIATTALEANNVSIPAQPVQKKKKVKKPKKPLTEEERKAKKERKARARAKRARKAAKKAAAAAAAKKASSSTSSAPQGGLAAASPTGSTKLEKSKRRRARKAARAAAAATSAGAPAIALRPRSVVDDLSERLSSRVSSAASSEPSSPVEGSIYDEATGYIDTFLSHPEARENSACRLALLQALIIELGLASSVLPTSLRAAKDYLKSHVFVNIREYLSVRKQGLPALQKIMHPSKKALIKDIRKNKGAMPVKMVKESGLNVLLVNCHYH